MFVHGIVLLFSLIISSLCLEASTLVNRWRVTKHKTRPPNFCWASVAQFSDDSAVQIGGDDGSGKYSKLWHLYNATTRSYTKYDVTFPANEKRVVPTVVAMGKKIYVIGGEAQHIIDLHTRTFTLVDDVYEFDPIGSTLKQVANAPIPMIKGAAAAVDDDQFVLFSGESRDVDDFTEITSNNIWSFNVKSKEWTHRGEMPAGPMGSNAAATLYDHFGVGKHGVFFLGGSLDDGSYDNRVWILNPETWKYQVLINDTSSQILPAGENHRLTAEKISGGTRVWAFGALIHVGSDRFPSNTLQFIDIPEGTYGSGPVPKWQLLPIVNSNAVLGGDTISYMLHRRPGMHAEPHIIGSCIQTLLDIPKATYSLSRNDPGSNGAQSLLYDDTKHAKDGNTILIQAGKRVDFRLVAYDVDKERLNYTEYVTSFLTHTATQQRVFSKINNMENGIYNFSYTPEIAGAWMLEVFINGEIVNNRTNSTSGINLNVIPLPPIADHTIILGDGVTNPTAGTWSTFKVQLRDMYKNTVLKKDVELANVSVTVIPNFNLLENRFMSSPLNVMSKITDDGIEIKYQANQTGSYKISTFMGDKIVQSSIDVDVVRDPILNLDPPALMRYNLDSPEAVASSVILCFTMVGIILCTGCMFGIIKYKDENVIKAIDIRASLLCLSGLMLLFISNLVWFSGEPTSLACGMWPFLLSIGLGVVFSTLAGKIWQVYKIFTSKVRKKVSKWKVIIIQGLIVMIDIGICAFWIVVDPPVPTVKYPNTYFSHYDCSSSSATWQKVFITIIISFNGLLICGGLALAYLTRNLPSSFNQAAHIAISMQSFTIFAIFGFPVLEIIDKHLVAKAYLRFLIVWVPSMITTLLLFGLRVFSASRTNRSKRTNGPVISGGKSSDSKAPSFVKYIATTTDTEIPGKTVKMNHFSVFWCQEHWLLPNIWLQSSMVVVPSIGFLAFTGHDYSDAHMVIDPRNAKLERIPANSDFQYMLRLRTQKHDSYLIGAFSSSDLELIEPAIKMFIANNVDCFRVAEKSERASFIPLALN